MAQRTIKQPAAEPSQTMANLLPLTTLALLCSSSSSARADLPPYFAAVTQTVLHFTDSADIGASSDLQALRSLAGQVKRVMAAPPDLELNVSALRDRPDPELLRILLLAVIGNFTSSKAAQWQQPCSIQMEPRTGALVISDTSAPANVALRVLVLVLCLVNVRQLLLRDEPAARADASKKE